MTKEEFQEYSMLIYVNTDMDLEKLFPYAMECLQNGLSATEAIRKYKCPSEPKCAPAPSKQHYMAYYKNCLIVPEYKSDLFPAKRRLPYSYTHFITTEHPVPLYDSASESDSDTLSKADSMLARIFDIHTENGWIPTETSFGHGFYNPKTDVTQIFGNPYVLTVS